ncbi:hypothetical protein BGZ73_008949 [Actinomortierella ambigua]|nr:hypothetical protein BGZ73_008949 [Actinomortierella ambigua]
MARLIELQDSVIETLLMERTRARWREYPEFIQLVDSLQTMAESNGSLEKDSASRLVDLFTLASATGNGRTGLAFMALEAYCAIADPYEFAVTLSRLALHGGEPYPPFRPHNAKAGWLESSLEYKEGLQQKGDMFRRLWKVAVTRGEGIETVATSQIIQHLEKARRQDGVRWSTHTPSGTQAASTDHEIEQEDRHRHDLYYMLHQGPLQDHNTPLSDLDSLRETLIMVAGKMDGASIDQQLLSTAQLLERLFNWIEDKDAQDDIDSIKTKVAHYAKTPILLYFITDSLLGFLEGRWLDSKLKTVAPTAKSSVESLLEMNMRRVPVRYFATEDAPQLPIIGPNATQSKSLKERVLPEPRGRSASGREFELSDLFARCVEHHGPEEAEQLMRRIILHLGMRVDTAMVGVTPTLAKHTAQQRDKILLQTISETPVYRRIMVSVMECDPRSASIAGPALLGMLRSLIAHWNTCKNPAPGSYPKDLETSTWLGQLIEKTGLVPYPASLAYVLFPFVSSKDMGTILEQVYFANVVQLTFRPSALPRSTSGPANDEAAANARSDQGRDINSASGQMAPARTIEQQSSSSSSMTSSSGDQGETGGGGGGGQESSPKDPELQLIHRIIFKHAVRTLHLLPLFCTAD